DILRASGLDRVLHGTDAAGRDNARLRAGTYHDVVETRVVLDLEHRRVRRAYRERAHVDAARADRLEAGRAEVEQTCPMRGCLPRMNRRPICGQRVRAQPERPPRQPADHRGHHRHNHAEPNTRTHGTAPNREGDGPYVRHSVCRAITTPNLRHLAHLASPGHRSHAYILATLARNS